MGCPVLGPSSADQYLVRKLQHVGKRKKEMCSALHVGVSGGHCARGAEYLRSQFGQKGTSIDKTKNCGQVCLFVCKWSPKVLQRQ
jgi:hypothetical protein